MWGFGAEQNSNRQHLKLETTRSRRKLLARKGSFDRAEGAAVPT
jgi:hypothetical protein